MTKFVSYVANEAIEKDAQALLAEYAHARGVVIEAPIAIDDIIEKHLKIGIEFDDTHRPALHDRGGRACPGPPTPIVPTLPNAARRMAQHVHIEGHRRREAQ